MQNTWFKNWFNSPYYHQLYAYRDIEEAAAFINNLIQKLLPPADARMLDVACGKGRHSKQLASKGFDVTGIDLSRESIKEASLNECDRLHFYEHDMRLPFWINYFDYAFNFFTSFGYFDTQREHDNAIRTIAGALKPKGTFVMDFLNVEIISSAPMHFEKTIANVHYNISKWTDERHFFKKIVVTEDALPAPLEYTEQVAKFTLPDFEKMFAAQGLQIKQAFGDYSFNAFDAAKSPRLIMVAEKQ